MQNAQRLKSRRPNVELATLHKVAQVLGCDTTALVSATAPSEMAETASTKLTLPLGWRRATATEIKAGIGVVAACALAGHWPTTRAPCLPTQRTFVVPTHETHAAPPTAFWARVQGLGETRATWKILVAAGDTPLLGKTLLVAVPAGEHGNELAWRLARLAALEAPRTGGCIARLEAPGGVGETVVLRVPSVASFPVFGIAADSAS